VKILHVIHSVNPQGGGPIEGIRQLVPALAALGIATEVMSLDAPDAPWTADFPVPLHATGPAHGVYGYTPRTVPWLRKNGGKYDAVIVNGVWQYGSFAVWRALRRTPTPYYVYPHGMLDPWFQRHYPLKHLKKCLYWPWAEYRVLRDAKAVLFTAEEEKLEARKSFRPYRCHELVTGYGIAAPPGDRSRQRDLFLERHPGLEGKKLLLFLGRIHVKKGCDLLLRAWKEVARASPNGPGAETHLIMAGPIDHAYGHEMKELARQLGLERRVTWTGMLMGDLKWGSLAAAEAFILPSHQENFGLSVAEALACGVPVLISNKVNIWREIAEDHAGLVENDDLPGTVRLLQRWFGLNLDDQRQMRAGAAGCFARRFDITRTAEALTALLGHPTV
jgi:glycosyltransferase involved in cell wall biosynthesis